MPRGTAPRRRPSAFAFGLMALGVGAFVVLLPALSGSCRSVDTGAASAPGARVLVIGDSYTTGRGSFDGEHGWAQILARTDSWRATIDGVPGSGYVNRAANGAPGNTYLPRVESHARLRPDLVIVQGSQNDWTVSPSDLQRTVTATLRRAAAQWPDAVVVAVGPSAPEPLATTTTNISEAVGDGARAAGVPYIDAVTRQWFTPANSAAYAAEDGQHLNDRGYRYLARRIGTALDHLPASASDCSAR